MAPQRAVTLFVDGDDVLLVEPADTATYALPGGPVRDGESPRQACRRWLADEFGLDRDPGPLRHTDPATGLHVFDGGALTDAELDAIELRPESVTSWAYVPREELFVMLEPAVSRVVAAALDAPGPRP